MGVINKDDLQPGQTLNKGSEIRSLNGLYRAVMQEDGNFVVYRASKALWASNTVGKGDYVIMQYDGNLVVYNTSFKLEPVWASNTQNRGHSLLMQNDGNLVLRNASGDIQWSSDANQ